MASRSGHRNPRSRDGASASGVTRAIPAVMGVINITPDSFYEGSRVSWERAVEQGVRMEQEGADFLDIGGESTRPGAAPVSADDEQRRVLPAIEALARRVRIPISIDTSKASVARSALEAGASTLNDVTALRGDPKMASVAAKYSRVILMHMQGDPRTMQQAPRYGDIVVDLLSFFRERISAAERAGIGRDHIWIDPGIGFGKATEHNLELFRRLEEFAVLERPIVIGASRKSFLGKILASENAPLPAEDRLEASLAVACRAAQAGAAVIRTHDVLSTKRALTAFEAVRAPSSVEAVRA